MTIEITSKEIFGADLHIEARSEKKAAYLSVNQFGTVNVLVRNASHKAYRGLGRFFDSFAEARAAYKSADVKAMLEILEAEAAHLKLKN